MSFKTFDMPLRLFHSVPQVSFLLCLFPYSFAPFHNLHLFILFFQQTSAHKWLTIVKRKNRTLIEMVRCMIRRQSLVHFLLEAIGP